MLKLLREYNQLLMPFYLMNGLLLLGTIGYVWIEGFTWMNAFYMTVITVATVGYGEVQTLSEAGRFFTIFLIMTSFGTFAYAVSSITRLVTDGEINKFFKQRKIKKMIGQLEGHVIICGFGRNGRQAAHVLKKHDKRFVVIEKNESVTGSITHKFSDLILNGNATSDEMLQAAGILKCSALITTLPTDADNLFIVLTARFLNPKINIISRASDDGSDTKLKIAGANNVIMPDKVGGAHMASLVMKPDVMEFIDKITAQGGENINLEEITFESLTDNFKSKTLKELEIRNKSGANIIGFKTADGEFIVNPSADTQVIPNSKVFVLGTNEQIKKMKSILSE
ncbi:MAG: potassium channel protein [Sphingobacteriaceae bacterium]|nr:potassium channel protein [Sphingobacteriaceae bacterium]